MEGDAWQSPWFGEGKDERRCQTPSSVSVAKDDEGEPAAARCRGAGTYGDGDDGDKQAGRAREDAGEQREREDGDGGESAGSNPRIGVRRGGNTIAASGDDNDGSDDGERRIALDYSKTTAAYLDENVSSVSSPSPSPGTPSDNRRPTMVDGGGSTSNGVSGGTRGASQALELQRPQGRSEPLTPRSAKRVLSPFWIPPCQVPPSSLAGPPNTPEARAPAGSCLQHSSAGSDGEIARERILGVVESGNNESPQGGVWDVGGRADAERVGASPEVSGMLGEAPDERVRQNMLHAQEIRDRYLRCVSYVLGGKSFFSEEWGVRFGGDVTDDNVAHTKAFP